MCVCNAQAASLPFPAFTFSVYDFYQRFVWSVHTPHCSTSTEVCGDRGVAPGAGIDVTLNAELRYSGHQAPVSIYTPDTGLRAQLVKTMRPIITKVRTHVYSSPADVCKIK